MDEETNVSDSVRLGGLPPINGLQQILLIEDGPDSRAVERVLAMPLKGHPIRWLRGSKMKDVDALFDEFSAALQFPLYFGHNWPAFDECLSDLSWITNSGLTIFIRDAQRVLDRGEAGSLSVLVRLINVALRGYAEPIDENEWWDRPAIPVYIILQAPKEEVPTLRSLWEAAGATISGVEIL